MHKQNHWIKLGILATFLTLNSQGLQADTLPQISFSSAAPTEISEKQNKAAIDYSRFITEDQLLLPRNLYILKGDYFSTEKLNIFHQNALLSLSEFASLSSACTYGQNLTGRWLLQSPSWEGDVPPESFELSLTARTSNGEIMGATTIELVDKTNTTPIRLLPIGDSLTRAGAYLSQVKRSIPNVTTLGTRFYPEDGMPTREGRGGWTLEKYCTSINSDELDSPFVFPTTISGERYRGNTRDWQAICYKSPKNPIYNGFQKIARGWKDSGDFLYNQKGYYKYPEIGDVMVDPSLPVGKQWVEWNGFSWSALKEQPTEFEFNFEKYMARYAEAFSLGTPTHVSLFLGVNEFGFGKQLDKTSLFMTRLNKVIDSIHSYDPNIKIILCMPTVAPDTNMVTASTQAFYKEYNLCVKYLASKLLENFDTDAALSRQIYLAPMPLTLDPINGFNYIEKSELVEGFTSTVVDTDNSIHPNNDYGQIQMGSTLAAVLQKYR